MPGMNGSQLAAAARVRNADLSIVFISGHADQIGDISILDDRMIRKPFSVADLHRTIEAALAARLDVFSRA